jgi:DNA modification methylase
MAKRYSGWLATYQAALQRHVAAIDAFGVDMVELDIRHRTRDRRLGANYAKHRNRLVAELDKIGVTEVEFCRGLGRGQSLSTMGRRMALVPEDAWQRYLTHRRERGDDGCFTLEYAVYLARSDSETRLRSTQTRFEPVTDDPNHLIIHGDALSELRKRASESVHCVITSPPYWPARRLYIPDDPQQIGLEPTLEKYLQHLMAIFAEVKRVLRHDGVCWVLIDDAISAKPYTYSKQSNYGSRSPLKASRTEVVTQDTTYLAPAGDWLGIPTDFSRAMQAIGWRWRDQIIWDKGNRGHRESSSNRCRRNYEVALMFTKLASGYWYDQDPLRIPLVSNRAHDVTRHSTCSPGWGPGKSRKDGLANRYSVPGYSKDGLLRRDSDRTHRVFTNPLGRICDAVWLIEAEVWRGNHSSAMPEKLVQNCLLLSCPPGGTVLDPFGGSGTVSKVAKQLGLCSIYIDRHEPYVREAQQRLTDASDYNVGAANDNQRPIRTAAD